MSGWDQLLSRVAPHDHVVQFYDKDEELLAIKVGHYLHEGWKAGDALLTVGEPERNAAVREQLSMRGIDPAAAVSLGRLVLLDAEEMVGRLVVSGRPDWTRFDALIGATVRELRRRHSGVRAYGEMVGILWRRGQYRAAARLEDYWNRLIKASPIALFCAYPVDVFGAGFDMQAVDCILAAHTHVLPSGDNGALGLAMDRAMQDVLGARAQGLKKLVRTYFRPASAAVPHPEGLVLWLRSNLPQYAGEILDRARQYYSA